MRRLRTLAAIIAAFLFVLGGGAAIAYAATGPSGTTSFGSVCLAVGASGPVTVTYTNTGDVALVGHVFYRQDLVAGGTADVPVNSTVTVTVTVTAGNDYEARLFSLDGTSLDASLSGIAVGACPPYTPSATVVTQTVVANAPDTVTVPSSDARGTYSVGSWVVGPSGTTATKTITYTLTDTSVTLASGNGWTVSADGKTATHVVTDSSYATTPSGGGTIPTSKPQTGDDGGWPVGGVALLFSGAIGLGLVVWRRRQQATA